MVFFPVVPVSLISVPSSRITIALSFSARGHDGSDGLLPANYAADLSGVDDLRTILDAEGLDRVGLFGHSAGGVTAFVFARRFPHREERIVFIERVLRSNA
jgi:pimeloyl-ACP methyl ester carboxylesterase